MATADGFGGAVHSVAVVEVGLNFPGSTFACPPQHDELGQVARHMPREQSVDFGVYQGHARVWIVCGGGLL